MTFDYNFFILHNNPTVAADPRNVSYCKNLHEKVGQSYAKMWLCYLSFSYSTLLALTSYGVKQKNLHQFLLTDTVK